MITISMTKLLDGDWLRGRNCSIILNFSKKMAETHVLPLCLQVCPGFSVLVGWLADILHFH
jgi:hypothetical protein